ncbi:hypothetical protein BKA63DRAFT_265812 [Paraphoma chrysanthemicola]|nr:hypothetical protein BKA63DRAFT_265812 [Paraphoma chrysanthemicola]
MKTVVILAFAGSSLAGPFSKIYHDIFSNSVSARGEEVPAPEFSPNFPQYSPASTGCSQSPGVFPTGIGYHPTGTGHYHTATGGVSSNLPYPVIPIPHKSTPLSVAPSITPSSILPEKGPGYPTYPSHTPDVPGVPELSESPCASSGFATPTGGWQSPTGGGVGYPGPGTGIHYGATTFKTYTKTKTGHLGPKPTGQPEYPVYENEETDGKGDKHGGGWSLKDVLRL